MAYKDKALQRETTRNRVRRYRALPKGVTSSIVDAIPLYNPAIHRAGARVRIQRGKREVTITIPGLDAEGNPIPDYE